MTRETRGGNYGSCPECFEASGIENENSDGIFKNRPDSLVPAQKRWEELRRQILAKGGADLGDLSWRS
jgi:hypothetical protein